MSSPARDTTAIRAQLLARQAELTSRAARLNADRRRALEPLSSDAPDRAIQQENDEVVDSLDDAAGSELHAIARALERIDAGRYGICTSCGHEIATKRLKLVPYADQCQSCATQESS